MYGLLVYLCVYYDDNEKNIALSYYCEFCVWGKKKGENKSSDWFETLKRVDVYFRLLIEYSADLSKSELVKVREGAYGLLLSGKRLSLSIVWQVLVPVGRPLLVVVLLPPDGEPIGDGLVHH